MSQQPDLTRESRLWAQGYLRIAGLDEAGRGAWAGPVVAAFCVLPNIPEIVELLAPVRDSKLLSARARDRCYDLVLCHAWDYGVGSVPAEGIDALGIVPATRLAMRLALAAADQPPDHLLIDAVSLPQVPLPQLAMRKGDRYCLSIAAASILAKVSRDRYMAAMEGCFPGYGLAQHKGYGTALHGAQLRALGSSSFHRHTFAPVRTVDELGAWATAQAILDGGLSL